MKIKCISAILTITLLLLSKPAYSEVKTHCIGEGPSLYLIGGGPAFTSRILIPLQEKLSQHYKVCRWDMRGVGDNADLPTEQNGSLISQWLHDMSSVLPREPVMLWGQSWGALQVLLFARQHPDRVRKIILSNPVDPKLYSIQQIEQKRFNHPTPKKLDMEHYDTDYERLYNLRRKIASYFVDPEKGWRNAQKFGLGDANRLLNIRVWGEYRKNPLSISDVKKLSDKIGGLIYCKDDVLQPENAEQYRRMISAGKHHTISGCAHFPWLENPKAYFDVLSDVVKE